MLTRDLNEINEKSKNKYTKIETQTEDMLLSIHSIHKKFI